jgi:hypothetical protein
MMRISSEVSFGILTDMPRYYYECRGTYYMEKHDASRTFWVVTKGYEIDIAEVHYPGELGISLHNWITGFGQLGRLQEGVEG